MNKKLLFAAVSLAALTACSTDDFQSQNIAAEKTSPVQFEVINNNDAFTRAYMDNKGIIHWEASKGDLFTLYHGGTAPTAQTLTLTNYQNATYTAAKGDGAATLTTPSMIKEGSALMIWPVDTAFTNNGTDAVAISIPVTLDNIEKNITYASDLVDIKARTANGYETGDPNTAGYNRKYPVYMRPLTSQLTLKADYNGTEDLIEALYEGTDPIDSIKVTSVDLTNTADKFTQKIELNFTAAGTDDITRWGGNDRDNAWSHITGFANDASTKVKKLTTKVLTGNESAKFLILPKSEANDETAIVVNTTYGKVVLGNGTSYSTAEQNKAWYKLSGTTKVEKSVKYGMLEVFTGIDNAKVTANTVVKTEPVGASATRYVKVLLNHLDMTDLHITSDKQLYDAVRVWNKIGHASVTVALDGDATTGEFKMSQRTIKAINEINAAAPRKFTVMPCKKDGEVCSTIVISGGGKLQDLDFILQSTSTTATTKTAEVALNEGENWQWAESTIDNKKAFKVDATNTGISKIINKGNFSNGETATLAIYNNASPSVQIFTVPFENAEGAKWKITAGTLNVQFNVTNYGTVNIAGGAQYRQDGTLANTVFKNEATDKPERFGGDDSKIGVVNNSGVFATVNGTNSTKGEIINYGLIEHATANAKTFITANQTPNATFASEFSNASGSEHKMGRINLPYSNKDEENISISSGVDQGFVSVTINGEVTDGILNTDAVGSTVNYIIVNKGIKSIAALPTSANLKYVEINQPKTEIVWNVNTASYTGLIVLSDVNISRGKTITSTTTYLDADMYVGGSFTCGGYDGYYGDTTAKSSTNIITY